MVEDAKSGGGSLISALSGSLGIDIGGMSGSNSMLAGDNVLELLRSSSLIKKHYLQNLMRLERIRLQIYMPKTMAGKQNGKVTVQLIKTFVLMLSH